MHKTRFSLAAASLAAVLTLTACNSDPETIDANAPDPQAEALANAAPVELPPAISASRTYRCADNSLLYAEFLTNDSVRIRTEKGGEPTILTAEGGNPPYTAEGYSLSANDANITYSAPGKSSQSCKA